MVALIGAAHVRNDPLASPARTVVSVLTFAFYALLVWAYVRRSPSNRTDLRWTSWLVAFTGTAAPFAIPVVSHGLATGVAREMTAVAVLTLGLLAMLWALGALDTNISVVPQAREVVSHGPYARVRHPLYAAELLNVVGLCLSHTGPWPWFVLACLGVLQVLRARREEALLTAELPGYAEYKSRTPMLMPGLGRS